MRYNIYIYIYIYIYKHTHTCVAVVCSCVESPCGNAFEIFMGLIAMPFARRADADVDGVPVGRYKAAPCQHSASIMAAPSH